MKIGCRKGHHFLCVLLTGFEFRQFHPSGNGVMTESGRQFHPILDKMINIAKTQLSMSIFTTCATGHKEQLRLI